MHAILTNISKRSPFSERRGWPVIPVLSLALGLATCALVWFGARATIEWQRATRLFVASRVEEASDRIVTGLRHDLTQATALTMTRVSTRYNLTSASHFAEIVGPALEGYEYVTVFFAWNAADDGMLVLGRDDLRPPTWNAIESLAAPNPGARVIQYAAPAFASAIASHVREFASDYPSQFGVFSLEANGVPYQAVARLLYPRYGRSYAGAIGFSWISAMQPEPICLLRQRVSRGT